VVRVLGVLVAVLLVAVLILATRGELPAPGASPSRPPVATIPARPTATPDDSIVAAATVVPVRSADLGFLIPGMVDAILVEEDEVVASGDILARLDRREHQAAVRAAAAELARAEATRDRVRAARELLPADATDAQREAADADVAVAVAEVAARRAALEQRQLTVAHAELRAQFSGTISAISVAPGELVVPGAAVLTLADLSSWRLATTDLSEFDVVRVAEGHAVTIVVGALPELRLRGVVERIQVRGATQAGEVTYTVIVRPDRHEPRLRWNMSATVTIATDP
jgi:RND family efflux transporter MFP subunit